MKEKWDNAGLMCNSFVCFKPQKSNVLREICYIYPIRVGTMENVILQVRQKLRCQVIDTSSILDSAPKDSAYSLSHTDGTRMIRPRQKMIVCYF